jgi:hypothetical protein
MIPCVLKTALDSNNNIQWQGLYVNGNKVLENFQIDLELALPIFSPNSKCEMIYMREDDFLDINNSFPQYEDFSYLLDYRDIQIGSIVWLYDGQWEVSEIFSGYRESGEYEYTEWVGNTPYKKMITYSGHPITKFKVKGKNIILVWEDYNYQQSYLYDLINNNKLIS